MRSLLASLLFLPVSAFADPPRVVTDILPVHSLVSRVMEGVGTPDVLVSASADPHHMHLRPSEARALSDADVVFAVGEDLTPWLMSPLNSVAGSARHVFLLDIDGTVILEPREEAVFEDEHDEHHGHDHDHAQRDPHAWLDPKNVMTWMASIADTLAELDPEHADIYTANARRVDDLVKLSTDISDAVAQMGTGKILVLHDSYQYLENAYGLPVIGAISNSDASKPGPVRLQAVRDESEAHEIACAFLEVGMNERNLRAVLDDPSVKAVEVDPLGRNHDAGAALIGSLLTDVAQAVEACAS